MEHYQRLKDLRDDKELKQVQIAELLETGREQYHKYETGKQPIPFRHVITLARFYNVSIDYIAGLIDQPKPLYTDPDVVNLMKRTYPMPDKARKDTI